MLAFAFSFFGLLIAIICMSFKSASGKAASAQVQSKLVKRAAFIKSIKATPEEIEESFRNDSFEDVLDDMKYISGNENLSEGVCEINFNTGYEIWRSTKDWRSVISNIRLSKIGKVNDNFRETYCIMVPKESRIYYGVYRYYEVLARNYTNAGIPMHVVHEPLPGYDPNLTRLNLSGFSMM